MLFLQLPLLLALLVSGDNEENKNSVTEGRYMCVWMCVCVRACLCVWGGFPNQKIKSISLVSFWVSLTPDPCALLKIICIYSTQGPGAGMCLLRYLAFHLDSEFPFFGTFHPPIFLLPSAPPHCLCSFPTGFQEPVSFQVICVLSFHNSSWVQSLGSGWLGELQTHGWKSNSGTFIYLWPWSKGNFSNEELMELQNFFHKHFIRFVQAFYKHSRKWPFECKFIFLNRDWGYARGCVGFNEFISLRNSL